MQLDTKIIPKPWGELEQLSLNRTSTIQLLTIKPQEELSLHYHQIRDDYWKVIKGVGEVILGEDKFITEEGQDYFIPKLTHHSIKNIGTENLLILEICFDEFNDTDTIRVSDRYGRMK